MYPDYDQPTDIMSNNYQLIPTSSSPLNITTIHPYFFHPSSKPSNIQALCYPTDTSLITASPAYQALLTMGLNPSDAMEIGFSLYNQGWSEPQILEALVNEFGGWLQPGVLPTSYSIGPYNSSEEMWVRSSAAPTRNPNFLENFRWSDYDEKTDILREKEDPKAPGGKYYDWSGHTSIRGVSIERPIWEERTWADVNQGFVSDEMVLEAEKKVQLEAKQAL